MFQKLALTLVLESLLVGCREPDMVHQYVPVPPDLALYDGVNFLSMNGMERYDKITIVPRLSKSKVGIILPDGTQVDARELTLKFLSDHNVECDIDGDDGQGNYRLGGDGIYAEVSNHRPTYIVLRSGRSFSSMTSPFSIELRGKKVTVPIERTELEAILGKPDEIKLKTPPDPGET